MSDKRIKDLELACTNSTKENEELRVRINQFDDHITTVANYLGAVCGGVDVETNIPGSTAFEIIKKIKEIENERNSLLLKAAEMLESLDVINKIIYGETVMKLEQALDALNEVQNHKASPASASEGWKLVGLEDLIKTVLDADAALCRGDKNAALIGVRVAASFVSLIKSHVANRKTLAAPTPPVSEDRKDAERYRALKTGDFAVDRFVSASYGWKAIPTEELDSAIDAAMQEGKP